jgi:hypothetical protein
MIKGLREKFPMFDWMNEPISPPSNHADKWLVKLNKYGAEILIHIADTEREAAKTAFDLNTQYATEEYFFEHSSNLKKII